MQLDLRILAAIGAVAAAGIVYAVLQIPDPAGDEPAFPLGDGLGTTYNDVNYNSRQSLNQSGITMSSPIRLAEPGDIAKFCSLFEGQEQRIIRYCTSTELLDSDGEFLGNIHAFGSPDEPRRVMGVVQLDYSLGQKADAKTVFSVLTEHTVCMCWDAKNSAGLSMDDWAESYILSHIDSGLAATTSNTVVRDGKHIQMRIITNEQGYEWQMLIA